MLTQHQSSCRNAGSYRKDQFGARYEKGINNSWVGFKLQPIYVIPVSPKTRKPVSLQQA
jgi:hypothetical protein